MRTRWLRCSACWLISSRNILCWLLLLLQYEDSMAQMLGLLNLARGRTSQSGAKLHILSQSLSNLIAVSTPSKESYHSPSAILSQSRRALEVSICARPQPRLSLFFCFSLFSTSERGPAFRFRYQVCVPALLDQGGIEGCGRGKLTFLRADPIHCSPWRSDRVCVCVCENRRGLNAEPAESQRTERRAGVRYVLWISGLDCSV